MDTNVSSLHTTNIFRIKLKQLSFILLILQTREIDVIGITRGRAQNWWMLVLICLWYYVDQNTWERNRNQMSSQVRYIWRLPMYTILSQVYPFLSVFVKLRKATVSFIMFVTQCVYMSVLPSARPQGTTRLPLGGFSWNLMGVFRKIYPGN
jgi:hypothetical protein